MKYEGGISKLDDEMTEFLISGENGKVLSTIKKLSNLGKSAANDTYQDEAIKIVRILRDTFIRMEAFEIRSKREQKLTIKNELINIGLISLEKRLEGVYFEINIAFKFMNEKSLAEEYELKWENLKNKFIKFV